MQTIEYKGWQNNWRLSNGKVELVITTEVGPRVIFYGPAGGPNAFKNYEEQMGKRGEKSWQIRGGHRLWIAPEHAQLTYYPDNAAVKAEPMGKLGVRLTPPPETRIGFQKQLDITLDPVSSRVRLVHRLKNIGSKQQRIAPWAVTVMAAGGFAIIPQPLPLPHGPKGWLPNRSLALWGYTDLRDPRYFLGVKFFTLRQDAAQGATKIGLAHREKWVGYLRDGLLFVKSFGFDSDAVYPDNGVNFETFTNEDMLELESLGPLVTLARGRSVEHVEEWYLFRDLPDIAPHDEAALEEALAPILPQIR